MTAKALVLVLMAFAVAPVAIAAPPGPAAARAADPRVRTVIYDPSQVYRIVGVLRSATQILFAPDEEILHVALGDASGWEAVPEGHVLFLKPTAPRRPTNLIVTSRRSEETRHYAFELVARSGNMGRDTPDTFFQVRFRYLADEQALVSRALDAEAAVLEARVLQLRLDRGVLEGRRNLAYQAQGPTSLAPSEVSDNGRFTVLRFPGAQAIPAIYAVGADGAEALVPFDVRGEFVVVHGVVAQLRLRRGREVVCLWNQALDPYGVNLGTGTAAADVQRTDKPQARP